MIYWVNQVLWWQHVVHCLSLLMLSLWCNFNVHFQSFCESSSCFEEFQVEYWRFIFIICFCIFSESQELSGLVGGVIGGIVGVLIIVMIILGILFLRRKRGNTYNHLLGHIWRNYVLPLWHVMISVYPSYILVVISC